MVNARLRRRAFLIERACFFDTCGAEKIKGAGSAKGFDTEGKLGARLIVFENPGKEGTEILFGCIGFYQLSSLLKMLKTYGC